MNDEQLSALIDGELPAAETRDAIAQLLTDNRARGTWARYHLLGDALRASAAESTGAQPAYPDNVVAFPTAIPTPAAPPKPIRAPRTGLALAAAAALAAVALIVSAPGPLGPPAVNQVAQTPTPPISVQPPSAPQDARDHGLASSAEPLQTATVNQVDMVREDEAERRLNVYLYDFNDKRARQSAPGTHSYVHIVGFERP